MDTSHIPDAVKQQIIRDADDAAYIRWLNQRDEQMKLHPELYPTLLDHETAKKILKESDLMKTK